MRLTCRIEDAAPLSTVWTSSMTAAQKQPQEAPPPYVQLEKLVYSDELDEPDEPSSDE